MKSNQTGLIALSVFLLLPAVFCGVRKNNTYKEATTIREEQPVTLTEKTVYLPTVDSNIIDYPTYQCGSTDGTKVLVYAVKDNLYFYDLTKRSIILAKHDYKRALHIKKATAVYFRDFNNLYFFTQKSVVIADSSLKVKKTMLINDGDTSTKSIKTPIYLSASVMFPPYFYPDSDKISFRCIHLDVSRRSPNFYRKPIEAIYSPETGSIEEIPVQYPELVAESFYGNEDEPTRTIKGDSSIYSFQYDPNIYVFNRKTGKMDIVGGKSKFQTADIASLSFKDNTNKEKLAEFSTTSAKYINLIYDPYREQYYRFFFNQQPLINADGLFNSYYDRSVYLMVFNKDFKVIKEFELKKCKYFPYTAFVTEEGLWLLAMHCKDYQYPDYSTRDLTFYVLQVK